MQAKTEKTPLNTRQKTFNITLVGTFSALAIVSLLFIEIPFLAAHLKLDIADVPIALIAMFVHPLWGLAAFIVVGLVQSFLMGGNAWFGFIMNIFSSTAIVLIMGYTYKIWGKSLPKFIAAAAVSTVVTAVLMIPANLIVVPIFMGAPRQAVVEMLLPVIIPFNLVKTAINSTLVIILFMALHPVFKRYTRT